MASTTSKYNQTLFARRKTSDIQRLANQYQKESTGLTGEYETAYSQYQKSAAEQLAPFEQAMKQYQEVDMPAYESSKSAYEEKLNKFNESLSNFQEKTKITPSRVEVGIEPHSFQPFQIFYVDGQKIDTRKLPKEYSLEATKSGNYFYDLYKDNPVPTFSGKAPKTPTAPTAPTIDPFNEEPYTKRRQELQTTYQRELAERKSARLGAAKRESARPMLQGA